MAKRKFRTKTGKVVEFETGGRRRGRGKASGEDAGAADSGEKSGPAGGGAEEVERLHQAGAVGSEDRAAGGGAEETNGGDEGDGREAEREAGREEARRNEARTREAEERREQAPGSVRWQAVSPEHEPTPPVSGLTAALSQLADFAYRVPQLAGLGDQWPLADFEARQMGRALEGCIKALPQKSKANAIKVLSRWLPWVSLAATGYIVTMPRIMVTMMGRRAGRGDVESAGSAATTRGDVREPRPSPDGPYGNLPSWEDYRGHVGR